jgi:methionyl-tRNA formyltransferase
MRIIYLGTPEFAIPPLKALLNAGENVVAAVSQPDREKNRKGQLLPTPVKELALRRGVRVYQFERIKREGHVLKELQPDLFITCAYGQILSQEILDIPKFGTFNIHASLLPRYRGPSPIQWALIEGERETGITIMRTEIGVDTGDIILQRRLEIRDEDDAGTLSEKLSYLGAECILEAVRLLKEGTITYTPQDHSRATHCPMIKKEDGLLDFSMEARKLFNRIRGLNPNPGCYAFFEGNIIKVHAAEIVEEEQPHDDSGRVAVSDPKRGLHVLCGGGTLRLKMLQFPGGKKLADTEFLKGRKIPVGSLLKGS